MSVEIIFKIAAIGVVVAVICQILKKSDRDDIAMMVSLAGLIIVLSMVVSLILELFTSIKDVFDFF